jgi:hypothetical protein
MVWHSAIPKGLLARPIVTNDIGFSLLYRGRQSERPIFAAISSR